MGLTLTNEQIDLTYEGLIKMNDNAGVTAVLKPLSDGIGTNLPFEVSTTGVNFTGTVTGLPVAAPSGLVSGTGTDSMRSGDSLTTIAATASGADSIALGDQSAASGADSIAIGNYAVAATSKNIAIGTGRADQADTIIIGDAVGSSASSSCIAIGNNYPTVLSYRNNSVCIGNGIYPSNSGVYIGNGSNHTLGGASDSIAIGTDSTTSAAQSISIGSDSVSTATQSVALGYGVTAATANTVTLKKLQMLDYATLSFADDAAAATGGIPLGGVYHTAGALKIRIA